MQSQNEQGAAVAIDGAALDDHEWLAKEQAAALGGVSPRHIERQAARGLLRKRTLPRAPGEATARVVYSRADVERLKAEPSSPDPVAKPADPQARAAGRQLALVRSPAGGDAVDLIAMYLSRLVGAAGAQAAPAPPRAWLTADEAAEFSGLPRAFLRRQARAGVPWAINVGSPSEPAWRFRRDALSAL